MEKNNPGIKQNIMINWIYESLAGLVLAPICACFAQDAKLPVKLELASAGNAHYAIRMPAQPSNAEQFAAKELITYLKEITKTNFGPYDNKSQKHIFICQSQSLGQLAPGIAFPQMTGEEYGICVRGQDIYLAGNESRSVLYVVYDFLGELGCKWLAPDYEFYAGVNESIPEKPELDYSQSTDIICGPAFKYRKLYVEEGLSHNTQNLLKLIEWMPKLHFNTLVIPMNYQYEGRVTWDKWRNELTPELKKRGILIEVGGHGWQNFMNPEMECGKLFEMHPEWFGMDNKGQRSKEHQVVFCTSNPEAVAYVQKNVLNYLDDRPEIDIFDFWPPDSERWCECAECKKLGSPSDRHAIFISQTLPVLKKQHPNLIIECVAYSRHVEPPQKVVLDKSVLLDFCPFQQSFEWQIYEDQSKLNNGYKKNLTDWRKTFNGDISIYSYYRKYAWRSLPNIIPHYIQKDLQFYKSIGINGISTYAEPGDWFTYGINYYILAHLASDPNADIEHLISDYCAKVYGSEADTVKSIYSVFENTIRYGCSIPDTARKTLEEYTRFATQINVCVKKNKAAMDRQDPNSVLYGHLRKLDLLLDYTMKDIEIMRLRESNNKIEARKKADEIQQLFDKNAELGIFVPHFRLISPKIYQFYKIRPTNSI